MNDYRTTGQRITATFTGSNTGQVAVGTDITQQQTIGAPAAPVTDAELADLRRAFTEIRTKLQADIADPSAQGAALERIDELEGAIVAEKPDVTTMAYVRAWFTKRLPKLAGVVTGVFVHPLVGKIVRAAGDAVVEEFNERLGGA
jgi:hypothetical protein